MKIVVGEREVSGIFVEAKRAHAILALAHGAGAGMTHEFLEDLAGRLAQCGVSTLRYQFPYMEDGKKRPDPPALATKTVAAAIHAARDLAPKLRVFAGGKSFGGRMSTTAAANGLLDGIAGIVLFGFPLHPAKEPATERARHLADVAVPMLFLQGTRDDLADLPLVRAVTKDLPRAELRVIEGADHSFDVLKKSGRTVEEVRAELVDATRAFTLQV